MTACLSFLDGTQTFSLSAENTKTREVNPSSYRRGQRGGGWTGVLLREVGNRCYILQSPLSVPILSEVNGTGYREALSTHPPFHPLLTLWCRKWKHTPLQRDNLCERQVLAARCRAPCPHWIQAGAVFRPKFLVCPLTYLYTPNFGSHIQMPATQQAQNLTKQRKTTAPNPSVQVDILWSSE